MSDPKTPTEPTPPSDFERESEQQDIGLLQEFVMFLRENKKWWMIPLIVASSGAAPFIYTLF